MTSRIPVLTKDAPAPMGGILSQGIVANGFVFTSGAIAQDPATGQVIDGDIEEHTVCKTLLHCMLLTWMISTGASRTWAQF
jgi:enamine deaminase RidA (YjgF/YER057c/UK114 family)